MTRFLFAYRVPEAPLLDVLADLTEGQRASRVEAWKDWFDSMDSNVGDRGRPVGVAYDVGNCGSGMRLGGYSLVSAGNLEEALRMAEGCPAVAWGGGVEVGAVIESPLAPSS